MSKICDFIRALCTYSTVFIAVHHQECTYITLMSSSVQIVPFWTSNFVLELPFGFCAYHPFRSNEKKRSNLRRLTLHYFFAPWPNKNAYDIGYSCRKCASKVAFFLLQNIRPLKVSSPQKCYNDLIYVCDDGQFSRLFAYKYLRTRKRLHH